MTDDFEGLDDDLKAVVPAVELVPAGAFITDMERLEPLVTALVAGFAANRIRMDDAHVRAELVDLRSRLLRVIHPLRMTADTIERLFVMEAARLNAKVIGLGEDAGRVTYEPPRGEYVTSAPPLRRDLAALALAGEGITREEIDAALPEILTVKPNHTKLNALEKRYGGPVADAIRKHRQYVAPPPERGRVRFPEGDAR